jgi:hypothetical protein
MSGRRSWKVEALYDGCFETFYHVGDEVVSMLVVGVGVAQLFRWIVFFIFVGAYRVCSSHSTHDVFSPAW